jgi:predicted lipid-binding transport protein (Tim44 family)
MNSKLVTLMLAGVMALGSLNAEAARRMGGGKSMGQQSNQVTKRDAAPQTPAAPAQNAAPTNAAKPGATPAAAAAPKKPWGAMLGGLAAGLGLAWLASSLGLGEAFGNILMALLIGVAVLAVVGMILRARRGGAAQMGGNSGLAYQGAGASAENPATYKQYSPQNVGNDASARPWEGQNTRFDSSAASQSTGSMIGSGIGSGLNASASDSLSGSQTWGVPAGFDVDSFVTAAKRNFVTLQDAWDRSDISALRSMMTDSMVVEIRNQLSEREAQFPGQPNKTEVVMLDAQLLGIEEQADAYLASVEFNGMIREDAASGPSPFREVWNMSKSKQGGGWLVAGVQALQ